MLLPLLFVGRCLSLFCAFISEQTPSETIAGLQETTDLQVLSLHDWGNRTSCEQALVFDFLSDLKLSLTLRELIECRDCIVNGNSYELEGKFLFPSEEEEHAAIITLFGRLSIPEVLLVCDSSTRISSVFAQSTSLQVSILHISEELSPSSLNLLARKTIKAKSVVALLLCVGSQLALKFLHVLKNCQLGYPVIVVLAKQASLFDRAETPDLPGGILFIADSGCEYAASYTEVVACRVRQFSSSVDNNNSFSVLQLIQGSAELVGSITSKSLSICLECLKWAPVPTPGTRMLTLQFSFNNGTANPKGATNTGEEQFYLGALLAVADINENKEMLPFSNLEVFNVSLGLSEFAPNWVRQQLAGVTTKDLGLAFLHGHYSNVAIPLYSFLTDMHFALPQIGADNSSPALSSPAFPYYSRVTVSGAYTGVMFARIIRHYGWTRFGLLNCDDLYCSQLAQAMKEAAKEARLDIVTHESARVLPTDMSSYPFELLPVFQQLIDSKARVVVLIMYGTTLSYCLEVLYDLGMRRGDLLFLPVMWLVPSLFEGTDEQVKKRKELLSGAVQVYPGAFIGPMGRDIAERLRQRYGMEPAHFACTNYDAVLLLAHTLDYLQTSGAAYEQASVLNHSLRKARFTGCSGDVSLVEGDRLPSVFDIQNVVVETEDKVKIKTVGAYKPLGTVLFSFTQNITWPDGTSKVPGDTRLNPLDCPFEPKDMHEFLPAYALEVSCFVLFGLLTVATTTLIWKKCWHKDASVLMERSEISFEDYLLFASIGIEAIQYAYIGPSLPEWLFEADRLLVFVDWDLRRMFAKSRKLLVMGAAASLGAVSLWLCLLLAAALKFHCEILQLAYRLLPLLGNVCFIPIVTTLLSLFHCGQAASASQDVGFADTYLLDDCYLNCWRGLHLGLAVPAVCALALYVPSAIYLRPKWQETQELLHVPVSPSHLMAKSLYQLLTITANKALAHYSPLTFSVVFLGLTAKYLGGSVWWRPYGYNRANLWHFVSLLCVIWYGLIATVSANVRCNDWVWLGLLVGGLGVLLVGAELLQLIFLTSLLYRKKGISIVDLFRFQFSQEPQAHHLFNRPPVQPSLVAITDIHLVIPSTLNSHSV